MISRILAAAVCVAAFAVPVVSVPAETRWQRPFSEVAELPVRAPDRRLSYGAEASQFAELWLPSGVDSNGPVVVLVHGGCWLADYGIDHVRPLAAALADAGFAVWAIEYRRVGEPGGGWPGTFLDVAAGIDRLHSLEEPRLDLARTVFVGHSAGGQLALWAAARPRLADDSPIRGAVRLQPRAALGLAAITDLAAYAAGDNSCQRVTPQLLGGPPEARPERYAQASPAALGSAVPTVLLQGGEDTIVPPEQAVLAGARVSLLPQAGHFDLIHPQSPAFDRIVALLEELLRDAP